MCGTDQFAVSFMCASIKSKENCLLLVCDTYPRKSNATQHCVSLLQSCTLIQRSCLTQFEGEKALLSFVKKGKEHKLHVHNLKDFGAVQSTTICNERQCAPASCAGWSQGG